MSTRVLIASGCSHATTTLYRCVHLQEQLHMAGYEADLHEWYDGAPDQAETILDYDLVVLHRVPITTRLERSIGRAQARGKRVLFDTDDLVFEPAMTRWHRGIQVLSPTERRLYHEGVARNLATLEACDAVLVSTPVLAELVARRGKPVYVHRNGLGREMTALGERLYRQQQRRGAGEPVVVGYGSGTSTHDVDFQQAALALLHLLATHPRVELWLVGPLQLPEELMLFARRVRRMPAADWRGWLQIASRFDVNLAPLEMDNLFCRAKSEIKVTEAALLGVPSVASRIDPFEYVLQGDGLGYLARNNEEWLVALEALVTASQHRRQIGERARTAVLARYGQQTRANQIAEIFASVISPVSDAANGGRAREGRGLSMAAQQPPLAGKSHSLDHSAGHDSESPVVIETGSPGDEPFVPLIVNWVLTQPVPGSGGFRSILRMIDYLRRFGHICHVYVQPQEQLKGASAAQIESFLARHFEIRGLQCHPWSGEVGPADATIATFWSTAFDVAGLVGRGGGQGYYLVQDFEPFFYPVSSEYAHAEHTYRLGLRCITLGNWLARMLRERYDAVTDPFDFSVNREIYRPLERPDPTRPKRVNFYARPSTPRRAYDLGVRALEQLHARRPDVEIVLYGADYLPNPPSFPHRNIGILNRHELAHLYATSDVGLVLSLTNPSLVPLEMMACGCAVVDVRSERVEGLLEDGVNCLLAYPLAEELAGAMVRLFTEDDLRRRIIATGLARVEGMSWVHSARQIEAILLRDIPPERRLLNPDGRDARSETLLWQIDRILAQMEEARDRAEKAGSRLEGRSAPPSGAGRAGEDSALMEGVRLAAQLEATEERIQRRLLGTPTGRLMARGQALGERLVGSGWGRLGGALVRQLALEGGDLAQQFRADRSHLCRIEILPAGAWNLPSLPLHVRLHRGGAGGPVVAEQVFRASAVEPERPLGFTFDPQVDSFEQTYTLVLSSPGAGGLDHHRFWAFVGYPYAGTRLSLAGAHRPGQLAFRYLSGEDRLPPRSEYLPWQPPVVLLPNRWQKIVGAVGEGRRLAWRAATALRQGGIPGVARATAEYIRWRLGR